MIFAGHSALAACYFSRHWLISSCYMAVYIIFLERLGLCVHGAGTESLCTESTEFIPLFERFPEVKGMRGVGVLLDIGMLAKRLHLHGDHI